MVVGSKLTNHSVVIPVYRLSYCCLAHSGYKVAHILDVNEKETKELANGHIQYKIRARIRQ